MDSSNRLDHTFEVSALIAKYINKNSSFSDQEKELIASKLFPSSSIHHPTDPMFDIDLLPCSFDLSISLNNYYALNNVNISDIMLAYSQHKFDGTLTKNQIQPSKPALLEPSRYEILNPHFVSRVFGMNNHSKLGYKANEISLLPTYSHVKTILGHMTMQDDMLGPTPIYCVCNIPKLEIAVTGDSNGSLKCWSTVTGVLVETFQTHEGAVNDMHYIEFESQHYIVSCSEDKVIKIIDIEQLEEVKTLCFAEEIIRISSIKTSEYFGREDSIVVAATNSGINYIFSLYKTLRTNQTHDPDSTNDETFKVYFDKEICDLHPSLKKMKSSLEMKSMAVCSNATAKLIACGFNEGLFCVWDFAQILNTIFFEKSFLHKFVNYLVFFEFPHSNVIQIVEFNKSCTKFITGSVDGFVLIWSIEAEVMEKFKMKKLSFSNYKHYDSDFFEFPCMVKGKMFECDNRMKPSVNVATWTCNENYVVSIISSKKKREGHSSNSRGSSIFVYDVNKNNFLYKVGEEDGLDMHDEAYLLEAHPYDERLILTSCAIKQVLVYNIEDRAIILKYELTNYFFPSVDDPMLILEGKFLGLGDRFVVLTYLGTVSFFSCYSSNSFDKTYMNQFFEQELAQHIPTSNQQPSVVNQQRARRRGRAPNNQAAQNNQRQLISSLNRQREIGRDLVTPKYVNMLGYPYTFQQPYPKLKLNKIEKTLRKSGFSEANIRELLFNNHEGINNTASDIQAECIKESQILEEIMRIELNRPRSRSSSLSSVQRNRNQRRGRSGRPRVNQVQPPQIAPIVEPAPEVASESDSQYDVEQEEISAESMESMEVDSYIEENSSKYQSDNKSSPIKTRRRNQNKVEVNDNTVDNVQSTNMIITRSRQNIIRQPPAKKKTEIHIPICTDSPQAKLKLRKADKSYKSKIIDDADSMSIASSSSFDLLEREKRTRLSNQQNLSSKMIIDDEEYLHSTAKKSVQSAHIVLDEEELFENCKGIESRCYFCGIFSVDLLGPFIEDDNGSIILNVDFSSRPKVSQRRAPQKLKENLYIHYSCLITYNDFIKKVDKKIDLNKSAEAIIDEKRHCFRCSKLNAAFRCRGKCDRYFHGYQCVSAYLNFDSLTCYDCIDNHTSAIGQSNQSMKNSTFILAYSSQTSRNRKIISRNSYLPPQSSVYCFFPQLMQEYYFIPQAYEQYLNCFHVKILRETEKGLLSFYFWKFLTSITGEARPTHLKCRIESIEYSFSKDHCTENGIYIKLKMRFDSSLVYDFESSSRLKSTRRTCGSSAFEYTLIYFAENNVADFLIHSDVYERSKSIYLSGELSSLSCSITRKAINEVEMYLDGQLAKGKVLKMETSLEGEMFECVELEMEGANLSNLKEKDTMKVSIWELNNKKLNADKNKELESLRKEYEEIVSSIMQHQRYNIFLDEVDSKIYPDYKEIVPVPICLTLIGSRLESNFYFSKDSILRDFMHIFENSKLYNGEDHPVTQHALEMMSAIINKTLIKPPKEKIISRPSISTDTEETNPLLNKKRVRSPGLSIQIDLNESQRSTRRSGAGKH